VVLSESLTYPGARAIAAQLGLRLVGIPMDDEGIDAEAFGDACKQLAPKALYVNPTLLNPTTHTISESRRRQIAAIARRYNVPIIEDDPYGFLPTDGAPPFAAIAPEVTWHVAGLAKCLGAGLRIAYVVVPDVRYGWLFASSVRTATVMASPVTLALARAGSLTALPTRCLRPCGGSRLSVSGWRPPFCHAAVSELTQSASIYGCPCRNRGRDRLSPVTCAQPESALSRATHSRLGLHRPRPCACAWVARPTVWPCAARLNLWRTHSRNRQRSLRHSSECDGRPVAVV
jgi:hypothetical protein